MAAAVFVSGSYGRTWTSTQGKKVVADVRKVNSDRTVELVTGRGKSFSVPFSTFSEADVRYLENLLAEKNSDSLHPVSWEKMNRLFDLPIWQDTNLWDDPTAAVGKRLELKKESKTSFMENYRSYPQGQASIIDQPVYALALYGDTDFANSLSMFFLNLGDIPPNTNTEKLIEQIEECGEYMEMQLERLLGSPERDSIGTGDLREKVWRWDWNGHAILLSIQKDKYTAIRIMPLDQAEKGGKTARLSDAELKQRMSSCVERRANGDVIITNIPMIDQGPKGYCSPATWERYLRFVDIPADMYLLALAANTGIGGGTYSENIIKATSNIISSYGRKLGKVGETPTVDKISLYIDKGLPVMWTFLSTPQFQREATLNTAKRNGWKVEQKYNNSGQNEDTSVSGHICLIIGYNETTGEIAISDSWGPAYTERWVAAKAMRGLSYGTMNIIKW
ncbi:C39 family peptidase [Pontiella agarivorans]|uniref:C39 family peptidase n=1 Tax=Pontiella agarivorans TaxID=3038953 RepID=A0ABU5MY01_9BACT|nr:C39 family peptidase [Pontiella agarivorans]MDZ8118856.1 C39 family peptidase [Pontiella agarivorans]